VLSSISVAKGEMGNVCYEILTIDFLLALMCFDIFIHTEGKYLLGVGQTIMECKKELENGLLIGEMNI